MNTKIIIAAVLLLTSCTAAKLSARLIQQSVHQATGERIERLDH